jgi:hypothetical protein
LFKYAQSSRHCWQISNTQTFLFLSDKKGNIMKFSKKGLIIAVATALTIGTASVGAYAAGAIPGTKAAAFSSSKISAAQAVDYAVAKIPGRAVEVDFRHKNGQSYYKVEIVTDDQKQEVFVDAANGHIIESRPDYDKKPLQPLPNTNISLKQAIAAAEAKTGGRAKDADLSYKKGPSVYKVETVNNIQKYEVRVDANSGQVLSSHIDL